MQAFMPSLQVDPASDAVLEADSPFHVLRGIRQDADGSPAVADCSVFWCGQRVRLPSVNGNVSSFRFVLELPNAACPALLVAGVGFQLVMHENERLVIRPLARASGAVGERANLQWLDGSQGQPLRPFEITSFDTQSVWQVDEDASLLLLNGETVFDVRSLQSWALHPANVALCAEAVLPDTLGEPARFLSPSRRQVVFFSRYRVGSREGTALKVFEFAQRRAYLVPFDEALTSSETLRTGTQPWLERHFQWRIDGQGRERLQWRGQAATDPSPNAWH